jgi:hypothetical protein
MLGAASVGLALEGDAESVLAVPPAVGVVNVSGVDRGVGGCCCGVGAPIAAAGVGGGGGGGAAMAPTPDREGREEVVGLEEVEVDWGN